MTALRTKDPAQFGPLLTRALEKPRSYLGAALLLLTCHPTPDPDHPGRELQEAATAVLAAVDGVVR
ncbi:hypothetical protein [Gordonia sp. SL306]|uniref:hypothetical protein n=1 Tax=Gordonia sp. SL306 TaxID=2995145 RepID=UPI00226EB657|nr:hypothetical protein [Gordonia sp. SL306]WAC55021.1 hypothetical protein OVA31_20665 [Gordonia sp. SL306]